MIRAKKPKLLSKQIKQYVSKEIKEKKEYEGDFKTVISTGSTLLDLEISGGQIRGGGIPGGIFMEIFGPSGAGKTILLCEIAGSIQRKGGEVRFDDPEARLNKQFAQLFDLNIKNIKYATPDKVTEVFENIREWQPKEVKNIVNGTFTDSLAALSTNLEMDKDEGDKMGMRRAKEFSEGFRKNARILKQKNYLMVCSNQIRENADTGGIKSPGGFAIGFYASLRLRAMSPERIYKEITVKGKTVKKAIGVRTNFEVFKSSIWRPFGVAPVTIIFDYGIDDIRENLQYIKRFTGATVYIHRGEILDKSMEASIRIIEKDPKLIKELKNDVIDLWGEIQSKFNSNRKKER